MIASDFVYKAVLNGCLRNGVRDGIAADFASDTQRKYEKGQYHGKVNKFIAEQITAAKKLSKR